MDSKSESEFRFFFLGHVCPYSGAPPVGGDPFSFELQREKQGQAMPNLSAGSSTEYRGLFHITWNPTYVLCQKVFSWCNVSGENHVLPFY